VPDVVIRAPNARRPRAAVLVLLSPAAIEDGLDIVLADKRRVVALEARPR
jgi:hypothetical protein